MTGKVFEIIPVTTLMAGFEKGLNLNFADIIKNTMKEYARNGYTTVTDLALGMPMPTPMEHIQLMNEAANSATAPLRLQGYVVYPLISKVPQLMEDNNDRFRVLGVKIWADGSTQGYTAALLQRYKGEDTCGTLNYTQSQLNDMVMKAHQMGLQLAVHANGDQAVDNALTAYEKALKAIPKDDPRFRIEHATVTNEDLLKRMAAVKATPSFTNQHIYYWGEAFKNTILGEPRADHLDAARSAQKLGMKYSFHDDAPLASINPLLMIEIGVTREMTDGNVLNPNETVSVDEAIKALTLYPAWQSFREKELGSIEVGKFADFVLLSKNPKKVDPRSIKKIKVLDTWVNGKKIEGL